MALSPLAAAVAGLDESSRAHLRRLQASWELLADFCFADLVLYVPLPGEPSEAGPDFVMVNHVRPATSQTIYHEDLTGEVRSPARRPVVARAFATGSVADGEVDSPWLGERVRVRCIPVRHRGRVIGVVAREAASSIRRDPGELEQTYLMLFDRFAAMIASGEFPYDEDDAQLLPYAPRVGDGVIAVDARARVIYASPNATSALNRFAAVGNLRGDTLGAAGFDDTLVVAALASGRPVSGEVLGRADAAISLRVLPLTDAGVVSGAAVLLRDVTDLRTRDRLLISKDATIREIHHRVKNNLQTISSLLRLQGRRLTEPSAKVAIEESVRRIRTIALVHETLSRDVGDDVSFTEIVRPLVRMVEEGLVSPDQPVRFEVVGDPGVVSAPVATSLAVVLTELLQNVVEHAYPDPVDGDGQFPAAPAAVSIEFANDGAELEIAVVDDGVGLPEGFDAGAGASLGLSIVRTLVESELGGSIVFSGAGGPAARPGTAVRLRVPILGPDADRPPR